MEQNFKNKIVAFYPSGDDNSFKPAVYFNVINGHTQSSLVFAVILGGIDLSVESFTLNLTVTRDDNSVMYSNSYKVYPQEMRKSSIIKESDIVLGVYKIGPLKFEVNSHSIHAYNASIVLKDDNNKVWDSAHTWLLNRPDKETNGQNK